MRPTPWRNWAGNQTAHPVAIEHPGSVEEVSQLVKAAAAAGRTVRVAGTGHSFTDAAATDGTMLRLDRLSSLVDADLASGLVTVQGGMPLHRLNRVLFERGLSMSNLGDIDRQTVAGALSTGTHGTGRLLGGLATQIRGLQLVTGDGSVITCSADERPDVFASARVGIGAFGVITQVTLQCEPAFILLAREEPMPLGEVVERIDDLADNNEHFEFYWFPHTERTLTKRNNRLPAGEPGRPLGRVREFVEDEVLSNAAYRVVCSIGLRRPSLVPRLNRTAARLMSARTFTAPSHEVFVSPRRVRFVEMEYEVPRAAVRDGLRAIREVIEQDDLRVSFPVEVRFAAGDDIPLSTASGRDSAYLAIHMFRGERDYERYFRAVESRMRALDGRPHWGKLHYRTAADLRPAYPRFDEFLAAREQVDPDRVFSNAYLRRVLGS
jgi:FAD-linked oxidoreductase